ncbi:lipid A biosynthesis lauroyl acyltransferase [Consotaella salsifontis]|uniref:KDO2-lipid IV(A) lauroyltransferase n=1 Tax=Consotaella salsifontis TaxID=1365950 RepID=A0A1T4LAP1_9HYPH|nr:lipid A biosynthesis lauroyl acyltransferase [Consotaella salsifontis]SJZ51852.1 KDO2-lipid IV(A) lauroyltransferase [Consotaella salsifontis]
MKIFLFRLSRRLERAKDWLIGQSLFALMALLRLVPPRVAMSIAARVGSLLGPLIPRHRVMLDNLRRAYPEKDEAWIERTARGNWREMGHMAAEYVFLDKLVDLSSIGQPDALVEVEGIPRFFEILDHKGPIVLFTAHMGCFELLPLYAAHLGLDLTVLFRPPNNRTIARRVAETRSVGSARLVPSRAGAAWALASALERGATAGMLVDQKFKRGVATRFFGRECRTNPLLPKLVRQFDCKVYPVRSVRLPGGRYRLEIEPEMALPRNAAGVVDVEASCQLLNDVVERWVREYPEQWMWFHRRWDY